MPSIKEFINENKKVVAVIGVVAAAVIIAAIAFNIINNSEEEATEEVPVTVVNPYKLPELKDVSITEQPILYDFIDGSLGLHEDLISMTTPTSYFTFISKPDSSQLYVVMNYGHQSDNEMMNLLPIFSSAPVRIDLNETEIQSFLNDINVNLNNNTIKMAKEEDYVFYAVPYEEIMIGNSFDMIDYDWLIGRYDIGNTDEQVINGMGIPTEIIRDKCDLQAIEEASGIDFNDEFWDNVNYDSMIKVYNRSDGSDYCIISPIYKKLVAGYGDPIYMFTVNGVDLMMTVDNLNDYLIENGYESIDDALSNKSYASEKEFNEKEGVSITSE